MPITSFTGDNFFLSNFYPSPITRTEGGVPITYKTVEHAYQAMKTLNVSQRDEIRECETPGRAKRLGATSELRPAWDILKPGIMRLLVEDKFKSHSDLAQKLLDTGEEEIIEMNNWGDTYWGVCDGVGQNLLGLILMDVRRDLREEARV